MAARTLSPVRGMARIEIHGCLHHRVIEPPYIEYCPQQARQVRVLDNNPERVVRYGEIDHTVLLGKRGYLPTLLDGMDTQPTFVF